MSFITEQEELKSGLIIFRRGDLKHRNWYCRVKIPNAGPMHRYKTIALKTPNLQEARDKAFDADADIRFRVKHNVPVFGKTWEQACLEYVEHVETLKQTKQISEGRFASVESSIRKHLIPYKRNI
ncbi:MAG: hypothetical protein WDO56_00050 [Gammaproteobacteria bacterium]